MGGGGLVPGEDVPRFWTNKCTMSPPTLANQLHLSMPPPPPPAAPTVATRWSVPTPNGCAQKTHTFVPHYANQVLHPWPLCPPMAGGPTSRLPQSLPWSSSGLSRTTPAAATKAHAPPAEVRTTPAETMKVRAMPTCTTRRDAVIGPHVHGNLGRQVADDQGNTRRGGAIGPHARRSAVRHAVDDLDVNGKNRKTTPATTSTTPTAPTSVLR